MRKLYPVSVSCEVLEVSASGYFNWLRRRESGHGGPARRHSDEALLAHIRAIHAEVKGEYGWPRMHKELLARGIRVGKDRVRKLMQQHGIKARTPEFDTLIPFFAPDGIPGSCKSITYMH